MDEYEDGGEFEQAAREAFPDQEWDEARLDALKTLVKICMSGDGDGESEPDGDEGGKGTLALLFGGPKKKK